MALPHFCWTSKWLKFPFGPQTVIVHGVQKNHASIVKMKSMQTNFGGHGLSGFWDSVHFHVTSKQSKFPFKP